MKITVIKPDGIVGINGIFRELDLKNLDPKIHAIQFDKTAGLGHLEYKSSGDGSRKANQQIDATYYNDNFQWVELAWKAAKIMPVVAE